MSGFKNMAMKENVPAPIELKPKFHKTFTEIVGKYGRMHEPELQMKLLKKTSPSDLLKNASLGIRMFRKGKLKLQPSRLDPKTHFSEIVKNASSEEASK
jgi:hypothetical protein